MYFGDDDKVEEENGVVDIWVSMFVFRVVMVVGGRLRDSVVVVKERGMRVLRKVMFLGGEWSMLVEEGRLCLYIYRRKSEGNLEGLNMSFLFVMVEMSISGLYVYGIIMFVMELVEKMSVSKGKVMVVEGGEVVKVVRFGEEIVFI